jgi:hypothetical protein
VFASDKPAKPAGPAMTKPTNADLARELMAAKAHIAELEAARPGQEQPHALQKRLASRPDIQPWPR